MDVENARSDPDLFLANHPAPAILAEIRYAPDAHWLQDWLADSDTKPVWHTTGRRLGQPLLRSLWRGTLPGTLEVEDELIPAFRNAYQRTYIERDTRAMADLGDWQQLGLFLRPVLPAAHPETIKN